MHLFKRIRTHFYRSRVRQVIARNAGIPMRGIRLDAMPKNDEEFEELVTSAGDWASQLIPTK